MNDLSHLITCERPADHVALIRINRPDKKNALHSSMVIGLARHLDELAADIDVRAVVITGSEEALLPERTSRKCWRKVRLAPRTIRTA